MMNTKVFLRKMHVELSDSVQYYLKDGDETIHLNHFIGTKLKLTHTGEKKCCVCERSVKKFFGQGFCYPCFANAPENSECIIRPELCKGHEGEGRDVAWEERNHVQPHIVYLALTSAVKVGVTRKNNTVNRWIDQGAWKAIELAEVPYRNLAGQIEVAMKSFMGDKTNWRKMLKNEMNREFDLLQFKKDIAAEMPDEFNAYLLNTEDVVEINYPVKQYPVKVGSLNFDKTPEIEGRLIGIRGQYLIFEDGAVLNIRKFTGYQVVIESEESASSEAEQMTLF